MKNIHILPTSQCKGSFKDCFKPLDECVCDIMKKEPDYTALLQQVGTKQETLEEVAEKLTNDFPALEVRFNMTNEEIHSWFLEALQKGAQWQQERSYSEEEVLILINKLCYDLGEDNSKGIEWFEQFKKK